MTRSKIQNREDRRQAVRAQRILSIQYRLVKAKSKKASQDTAWHISTTHDMSALGLAFLSEISHQIGDILELNIVMSGVVDIYKGLAQVVRVELKTGETFLVAVKFVEGKI